MTKLYVASKAYLGEYWQSLRPFLAEKHGVDVISTWIDESGEGQSADMADLWVRCIAESRDCDFLVATHAIGDEWKGAFVEIGSALSAGKPVFVMGNPPGSWINHPLVTQVTSIEEAIRIFRSRT